MLDERIAELIQADVDGELPASDRAELEQALVDSDEACRFRDEMLRIARLLSTLPAVEPPPGLSRRILDRVELPSRSRWGTSLGSWFQPASYGLAVAAGVLMTLGIVRVMPSDPMDISSLVGSMVRHGETTSLQLPEDDRLNIQLPGIEGNVALSVLERDTWAMEFDISADSRVDWLVGLADSGRRFGGFASHASGVEAMEVAGGDLRVVTEGRQRFVVFLRAADEQGAAVSTIDIALNNKGKTVYSGKLSAGEARR